MKPPGYDRQIAFLKAMQPPAWQWHMLIAALALGVALVCTITLAGCAPTPLQASAVAANGAKLEAERAEAVLSSVCAASYDKIARLPRERRLPEVARIDPYCQRTAAALETYESARDALLAAIVAADLEVPGAPALLADRRARLTAAGHELAIAIEGSH